MSSQRIHGAIVAVMREIGALAKDGENVQQKYRFRSIEQVYNRVQPLMAKHGIYSVPQVTEREQATTQSKSGGTLLFVTLTVKYTFAAEDGSSIEVTTVGQGMDAGDKAASKAMTAAHKYAICQLFNIPFEQLDPDRYSPEIFAAFHNRVSMRDLGELKKQWHGLESRDGADKAALAEQFREWVKETTGHDFDVSDPRLWTRDDYVECTEVIDKAQVTTEKR